MRRDVGFTLLEVMVALVLVAVSLAGALTGITVAERAAWRAEARMRATTVLGNRVAELRAAAGRTDPRCLTLESGRAGSPPGPVESWDVVAEGAARRVAARVRIPGPWDLSDSIEVIIRCH